MKCQLLHLVRSPSTAHLVRVLAIFGCAFAAYYPALHAGLVFDDQVAIVKNADLRPESSLLDLFTNDYWGTRLSSHLSHKSYRPLTVLTFRLNYLLHKLKPFGYHLANVVLHAIASSLVYRLSLCVLRSPTSSLLAGAIFALHPVHSDAVISVVGRAELLSAIFYLSGLLLVIGDGLRVDCTSKWRLAGSIVLGSLGLLCKEQCLMLIPLLVCFLLVDNLELLKATTSPSKPCKLVPDALLSSLLFLHPPFSTTRKHPARHNNNLPNQIKLNQLDKKLRKSNKVIWTLVVCFAIVLSVRLAAQGGTLSVHFSALDQIQSMVQEEAGDRFQDAASSNVTATNAGQPASINGTTAAADEKEDRKTSSSRKFNSLSAFLTSAYVIAHNFWLLFYPDRLSCDWSFGSLAPVRHLADARNLFSFALLVGLGLVPFLKCLNFNHQTRSGAVCAKLFLLMLVPFAPVLLLRTGFILAERTLYLPSIGFCLLIALIYERRLEGSHTTETKLQTGRKILYTLGICLMLGAMAIKCQVRSSDWKTERSLLTATLHVFPSNVKMLVNKAKMLANDGQLEEAISHYDQALRVHDGYLRAYGLLAELHYAQNRTDLALSLLFKAKDLVMTKLDCGQHIAQESMRTLIRLEQLLQLHRNESIQHDIVRLYEHLPEPASGFLSNEEIYNLAVILRNNRKLSDSIGLLAISQSKIRHTPSLELYNELVRPQQAVNHFRSAMKLLRKAGTASQLEAEDKKIRYHLERSIFYDPALVQAYYNLALLDYRRNTLRQATRDHLQRVLQLQPSHSKAQLMLCDLALELQSEGEITDQNLFEAVRCYTKLLDSQQQDLRNTNLSESKASKSNNDSSASKSLAQTYSSTYHEFTAYESTAYESTGSHPRKSNEESEALKSKVMRMAHHNLCSVLDLIANNQLMMASNATMNISNYCSSANLAEPFVQQIHFQVPTITST